MKIFITVVLIFIMGFIGAEIGSICNSENMLCTLFSVSTAAACILVFLGYKK